MEEDDSTICSMDHRSSAPSLPASRVGSKQGDTETAEKKAAVLESEMVLVPQEGVKDVECGLEKEDLKLDEVEWTFPDGGWKAWSVVFGCFVWSCCQMAYGLAWSVLVQDLHTNSLPHVPLSTLNFIAGLNNFVMNGGSLIGGRLGDKYGYKNIIAISGVATFISLLISAFSSHSLPLLFIFQGFFLGASMCCGMPNYMSMPSQWFLKNRGVASGIAVSGAGIGGGFASLIIRALLPRLGYRDTLLVYACMNATLCFGAWFLLEERRPPLAKGQLRKNSRWFPVGVWNRPAMYLLMGSIAVGIFGYLSPYYYLTPYTILTSPNLHGALAPAVPVIVAQFLSGIGRCIAGLIADRIGPLQTLFLTFFVSGLMELVFWPFAHNYGQIIGFAGLYGFFGGWFMSLIPASAAQLFGMENLGTLVGAIILAASPGQLSGASIAGVILSKSGSYKYVAWYAGSCMVLGSLLALCARFSRERRLWAKF